MNTATPTVPALVEVPHVLESTPKKWAATALNADAMLMAMHAMHAMHATHVAAIAQSSSSNTTQTALAWAYTALQKEAGEAFAYAKRAGGLLFAFHGSAAFQPAT